MGKRKSIPPKQGFEKPDADPPGVPDLSDFYDPTYDDNFAKFNARLEPWPGEPQAIFGEAWHENIGSIERDPVQAYSEGETPHLHFANLSQQPLAALRFVDAWAPLRRTHYLPTKAIEHDLGDHGVDVEYLEPHRFRVPLTEFWREQQKFRQLVCVWADFSQGKTDAPLHDLRDGVNIMVKSIRPQLELDRSETRITIASHWGADFLTKLYFLLWLDIANSKQVRRCADESCGQFFRPSRASQIYHAEECKRRKLQREYKRAKTRKRKGKK